MSKELIDISLIVLTETIKAWKVTEGLTDKDGKQIEHWLPKSQVEPEEEIILPRSKPVVIAVPRWLVEEKGLTCD